MCDWRYHSAQWKREVLSERKREKKINVEDFFRGRKRKVFLHGNVKRGSWQRKCGVGRQPKEKGKVGAKCKEKLSKSIIQGQKNRGCRNKRTWSLKTENVEQYFSLTKTLAPRKRRHGEFSLKKKKVKAKQWCSISSDESTLIQKKGRISQLMVSLSLQLRSKKIWGFGGAGVGGSQRSRTKSRIIWLPLLEWIESWCHQKTGGGGGESI